jgi:hypothetical protein
LLRLLSLGETNGGAFASSAKNCHTRAAAGKTSMSVRDEPGEIDFEGACERQG